jgi:3'-5' exoribonuclease
MWDNVEDAIDACDQDDFIKVKGLINKYKNRFQLTIHKLRRMESRKSISPTTSPRPQRYWRVMADPRRLRRHFKDPHLKALVEAFMADPEIAEAYRNAPAGQDAASRVHWRFCSST